ncbi:MAG: hypothetical protein RI897_3510 [Verrucomicrobiota bacterium]
MASCFRARADRLRSTLFWLLALASGGLGEEVELFQCGGEFVGPFFVADFVGVEEVGELFGFGVALIIGKDGPGIEQGDLGEADGDIGVECIDVLDGLGGAGFGGGAGEDLAENDGELGVMGMEHGEEELEVIGDGFGCGVFFEVIGADEEDDGFGVQGEDIFLEADDEAAGGIATDAAVGDFHAGEAIAEVIAPALGDGVAEEDDGALVLLAVGVPLGAAVFPEVAEPVVTAYGAIAGERGIGFGEFGDGGAGGGMIRPGEGVGLAEVLAEEPGEETGFLVGGGPGVVAEAGVFGVMGCSAGG